MSKGATDLPDATADLGAVDEADLSSNQEAVVIPFFCGEAKFAVKWLCYPFKQFTKDAPTKRPGKK